MSNTLLFKLILKRCLFNILNSGKKPVLFEETSKLIPPNAVMIEVAPHGLLQAILKRSLPASCKNIPLARRGHIDNTHLLLEAIGQLYLEGYYPNLQVLYPKVDFPVSTETPQLSHLINWVHDEKWLVSRYETAAKRLSATCGFIITYHEDEYKYLKGNIINGRVLFPFAGALVAAWDALCMSRNEPKRQKSVHFSDVHLFAQPVLHDRRQLKLSISIEKGTGRFEVLDNITKVASGYITVGSNNVLSKIQSNLSSEDEVFNIDAKKIYEYFYEKDYGYSGEFCNIHSANDSLSEAYVLWNDNWVTLLDSLIQLNALRRDCSSISQPTYIGNLIIDTISIMSEKNLLKVNIDEMNQRTRCENVIVLERIQFRDIYLSTNFKIGLNQSKLKSSTQQIDLNNDINIKLHVAKVGNPDALQWIPSQFIPDKQKINVHIHYAGLSCKDVRKATNKQHCSTDDTLTCCGIDFSGLTDSGEHVMGLVKDGAVSTKLCAEPGLLWPVPDHWSLEDAATVSLAYAQAFYCLTLKSSVRPGNRVLIHGGAGALGQATISVALALGCEVFTTVSNNKKKLFLLKLFPELKESHIGHSRNASFEDIIMNETNGKGCDVVISSVPKELKYATLRCIGFNGRMIDLEQLENLENFEYTMFYMTKQRSYIIADLSNIFEENSKKHLYKLISEGIVNGSVRPLSRVVYEASDAPRAFRFLASSQQCGRVLLSLRDSMLPTTPRLICNPLLSHVIVCETSLSAGIRLGNRLISRGAAKLIICSQYQSLHINRKIKEWRQRSIEVTMSCQKLDSLASVEELLRISRKMGPIEGIYVIANELKDIDETSLIQMIDFTSQKQSPDLKYFALIGSRKKSSEEVIVRRAQQGLPTTMLYLPTMEKITSQNVQSITNGNIMQLVVDATEQALLSPCPVLEVQPHWPRKLSLFQQVAATADITLDSKTKNNNVLRDLGINDTKCTAVHVLLRDHYNIFIDRECIPDLTLERLRVMEEEVQYSAYSNTKGLGALISYVDPDELQATAEFISMTTLTHSVATADEQFDVSEPYLCIIPGIEGHHAKFNKLCAGLKIHAITPQPGLDRPYETVKESAQRYAKTLLDKDIVKEDFYLLGYETGIYDALETAAILEKRGLTGTVFCIGCVPDELQEMLNEQLTEFTNENLLEDGILHHMFAIMNGGDSAVLDKAIACATGWSNKLEVCVRMLLERVPQSAQYTRGVIESALLRIIRARAYRVPVKPLRSRVVLLQAAMKPKRPLPSTLQQHSLQPVVEYQLTAPFAYMAQDLQCAAIINRHLSPKLLESFESKNRCETYFLDN